MPNIHKSEPWRFKKEKEMEREILLFLRTLMLLGGWVFDGPERGGEFLGLLALNRRPLGYLN